MMVAVKKLQGIHMELDRIELEFERERERERDRSDESHQTSKHCSVHRRRSVSRRWMSVPCSRVHGERITN